MTFESQTIYLLKDRSHFDDEYGEGYDHVETFGDCDGVFVTDCWPVNANGEIHPGYNSCPVPVKFDSIELKTDLEPKNQDVEPEWLGWR